MSFLSNLLNPEPAKAHGLADPSPTEQRRPSLPPIQYAQSPDQQHATVFYPQLAQPSPHLHQHRGKGHATAQEAAQALAALSHSSASPPPSWYGAGAPAVDHTQDERRRSQEHRPRSSGFGAPSELPPPTDARKMSSPSLTHYHMASRSPEERRTSIVPLLQPGTILPPLQGFAPEQQQHHQPPHAPSLHSSQSTVPMQETLETMTEQMESGDTTQQDVDISHHATEVEVAPPSPSALAPSQQPNTNMTIQADGVASSPAHIKQEPIHTPQASSPIEARRSSIQPADFETTTLKAVAALKNEHSLRVQSPLRESSVPMLSTETPAAEQSSTSKKRPAPKTKKGMATSSKKAPPSKKRRLESKRSATPSSVASKPPTFKTGSSKGTPANSSPAPSNRSYSAEANDDEDEEEVDEDEDVEGSGDVYCICRKPDNGTFMIGCDGTCDDWFHGKCVGIEERDKNLIDKYMCPTCSKKGIGRTTWKRMCRRGGCRQPARVGKSKGGRDGSKYCSEECGVLFFRDMVAKTRGREDTTRTRSNRRRNSNLSAGGSATESGVGARGGVLAAGEIKGLLDSTKTAQDFKKLGEGVLSPPATPDGKEKKEDSYTEAETQALTSIMAQKDVARHRHQLLKDRMKFVTLVKQAASCTATERELKTKDYCGYDPRLEWTEAQFKTWRESPIGKQAFDLDTLAIEKSGNGDTDMAEDGDRLDVELELCDRKKCARHLEWSKLAVDDLRFEMTDNSDHMRALDREERDIKERAALRAKVGSINGEGSVEVHGVGIVNRNAVEAMDVDVPNQQAAENAQEQAGELPVMTTAEESGPVALAHAEEMVVDAS